jgi:hypothetical protein
MVDMATRKRQSMPLDAFEPSQLAMLVDVYPTIRRELHRMGELCQVRLPDAVESERRLAILRELEAKGDLCIRISYAGNLNVMARSAPEVGEEGAYLGILRRPATDWCKPAGRYYPDELVGEIQNDVPVDPMDDLERAQYRVAGIVADEIPGVDPAVARRIAERVMQQLRGASRIS